MRLFILVVAAMVLDTKSNAILVALTLLLLTTRGVTIFLMPRRLRQRRRRASHIHSGRAMVEALIAGESDPAKLARLANYRLKTSQEKLREALRGRITNHHRFLTASSSQSD
jgi:hypothetical protein